MTINTTCLKRIYEKLITNANRNGLKGQNRNTERWEWKIDSFFFFYMWLKVFDFCVIFSATEKMAKPAAA